MLQHRTEAAVRGLIQSPRGLFHALQSAVIGLIVVVSAALMVITAFNLQ